MSGKLIIVPTPIGNLEDITLRALRILDSVDFILAEDTRTSSKLLKHYKINTPIFSYHLYNEHHKTEYYVQEIYNGKVAALISDAGTPGISDPGFMLIRSCINKNIETECLPGATAFVPALVISGLSMHEFIFVGFLPQKKGRQNKLRELAEEKRTIIIYESPHKIISTLKQILIYFGKDRKISLSRELSKLYEETERGSIESVLQKYIEKPIKGEIVLVIDGI